MITVSIVSHGHGQMVVALVRQLLGLPEVARVVVTLNIPEKLNLLENQRIILRLNQTAQGFGANHNAAFSLCETPCFCVLNPDIELIGNPFARLSAKLSESKVALCAPLVLNADDVVEDSVREFITPWRMVLRKLGFAGGSLAPVINGPLLYPDWVAGMFMLFDADAYRRIHGFDTAYFMYCEDADICTRLWQLGLPVMVCPEVQVIHHAQRASRRSLRHLRWHVSSMLRYIARYWGRLPRTTRPL